MEYQDLKLERAVIDVRYPIAYRFWDRAGALWTSMQEKWTTLGNVEGNPAKLACRLDLEKKVYELTSELTTSRVVAHAPKTNLDDFQNIVSTFMAKVLGILEIAELSRVGFRLIYYHEVNSREAANELVARMKLFQIPEGQFFGFKHKTVVPELTLRFMGEEVGATVKVGSATLTFDFVPPPGIPELQPVKKVSHRVIFDVDYFTIAKVNVSQMNFDEWIPQIYNLVKKDSNQFLKRH